MENMHSCGKRYYLAQSSLNMRPAIVVNHVQHKPTYRQPNRLRLGLIAVLLPMIGI